MNAVDAPDGCATFPCSDGNAAKAEVLERFAALYRANQNPDDLAFQLLPIVRSWQR